MAVTKTLNYFLNKIGQGVRNWATYLDQNADIIDGKLKELDDNIGGHKNSSEAHDATNITYDVNKSIKTKIDEMLVSLQNQINGLNDVYSTDVERINAINQLVESLSTEIDEDDQAIKQYLLTEISKVQLSIDNHKIDSDAHDSENISFDNSASDLISVNVEAVVKEVNTKVNINNTNINNSLNSHINSGSAHNSSSIVNQSSVEGGNMTDTLNKLKNDILAHISNIFAHSGDNIGFNPGISGLSSTKVTPAIIEIKNDFDAVITNVTVDSEVQIARNSGAKGVNFTTLDNRLESIETDSKFFWKEEHSVLQGENTITLTNIPENEHYLEIRDKQFKAFWDEGVEHEWTREGQIITFTSTMPCDLDFTVINWG